MIISKISSILALAIYIYINCFLIFLNINIQKKNSFSNNSLFKFDELKSDFVKISIIICFFNPTILEISLIIISNPRFKILNKLLNIVRRLKKLFLTYIIYFNSK